MKPVKHRTLGPRGPGSGPEGEESADGRTGAETMKCTVCGAKLKRTSTDLPFKVGDTRIVIVKDLPVLQCPNCPQYLIDDQVLARVDEILARVETSTELEIIRYAA
jgi:YgiT-type zinc finger domain-containing protein